MWVIAGKFKSLSAKEGVDQEKFKLLRPNHSYTLGRKDGHALVIDNNKLSKEHCKFTVGPHTVENVSDLDSKPTLEMANLTSKDKAIQIKRDSDPEAPIIPPTSAGFLQDGDVARIVATTAISVRWEVVNVYVPPELASAFSKQDCAALGIKVVHAPDRRVSHHITPDLTFGVPLAASLLSLANFATPDWLAEVIRLGQLPRGEGSLEDHFSLPPLKAYQPEFAPDLPSRYKIRKTWLPKEERLHLFADLRFICFFEKVSRTESDLADAIHQGNGDMEKFDVNLGIERFRRALTRSQAKEGKKTVVIADADAMQLAVGKQQWQEYVVEANQFSLAILPPAKIIEAALEADVLVLLTPATPSPVDSSIPSQPLVTPSTLETPNTTHGESSISNLPPAPPTVRPPRLVRRVPSRAPSIEPSVPSSGFIDPLTIEAPRPRKPLTRRANTAMVTGLEDPSGILDAVPDLSPRRRTPPQTIVDLTAPTPARPNRLKRRVVVEPTPNTASNTSEMGETIREPPLKKFKALFESADPESQAMDSGPVEPSQTQPESEVSQKRRPMGASTLDMLREEEEETPPILRSQFARPSKRRVPSGGNPEGDNMTVDQQPSSHVDEAMPPPKRRAVENFNAVEKSAEPGASGILKTGAPAGKPDTNQAFLKALASTKRGKKTEDEFDRDFNHLKISKPALEREQTSPEDELKVLADFGDDSGLRGNFMVVVEMDVPDRKSRANQSSGCDWTGKPNFKKFKKKISKAARHTVDLFATDQDFGMGSAYWKNDDSSAQFLDISRKSFEPEAEDSQDISAGPSEPKNLSGSMDSGDVDEDLFGSQVIRKTTRSRASSRAPSVTTTLKTAASSNKPVSASSSRSKVGGSTAATKGYAPAPTSKTKTTGRSKKATPLFLDSQEDIEEEFDELQSTMPSQNVIDLGDDDGDDDETMNSTLPKIRSSRRAPSSRGGSAVPAAAPKASTRKTTTTKTRMSPIMFVDDSDDDGGFKGFG